MRLLVWGFLALCVCAALGLVLFVRVASQTRANTSAAEPAPYAGVAVPVTRTAPTPVIITRINPPIPGLIAEPGVTMTGDPVGGDRWFLSNGTAVQMLAAYGAISQVQVMDGPQKNRVGWIPTNAMQTR